MQTTHRLPFFSTLFRCAVASVTLFFSSLSHAVDCVYTVTDEWNTGFNADITITNDAAAPLSDWALSWTWPGGNTLTNHWNATVSCVGSTCSATPPGWNPIIASNSSYSFGLSATKINGEVLADVEVNGAVCDNTVTPMPPQVLWQLDGQASSVQYVSMKKDHTAEVNFFEAQTGENPLQGSIDASGNAILSIDLNAIQTGIDIRNTRLLSLLFETQLLPTAYFNANIDINQLTTLAIGETQQQSLSGELSLHGIRQAITAEVMIAKVSAEQVFVTSLQPVLIDSKLFDMAAGVEALRVIANLSSIGEAVPVYFHLSYAANTDINIQPAAMPIAPTAPSDLAGTFDEDNLQANLTWSDNSDNESQFLVRRRLGAGYWQTSSELSENTSALIEALPEVGEYDYKVIALNQGVPSDASNVARVAVSQGNPIVRGQTIFVQQCAGCHGVNGEGIASFPAINTSRDVPAMIAYIQEFMPVGNPGSCDQQCAEDVSAFIETLWVADAVCDVSLTPVSYGARQLKILTRTEFQRSVEDLLGVDYPVSQSLSADNKVGFFTNNTYAAIVPNSYSNYLLVAEDIATWSAQRDFSPALSCSSFDQDCADSFINELAPKIFRRPLSTEETSNYANMSNGSLTSGDVKAGIQMALEGMLSSPQFLYRHELGEINADNSELDADGFELTSYEMATFLAYTFTGSTPDQTLLDAAARDELRDGAEIMQQAQRLTAQANNIMGEFIGSWLGTAELANSAKDEAIWPGFNALVGHMQNELNSTFSHIMLTPDESFASLYTADYTFLNETLATHYGIDNIEGDELRKVTTNDRGGILANGAFLSRWSEAVETSPILRSVRVRRRMLCQDQPDPPAGTFAAREEKLAELSTLLQDPSTTNRLKYHRLTEDSPCTNCHLEYINPLGFGMEDFDSVGNVRTADLQGNPIDAAGQLYAPLEYSDISQFIDFDGTKGLGSVLAGLDSAQSCLPKQLFRYVMGVGHEEIDASNPEGPQLSNEEKSSYACEIDQLTDTMMDESPRAMLEGFAALKAVRYRKAWARQ